MVVAILCIIGLFLFQSNSRTQTSSAVPVVDIEQENTIEEELQTYKIYNTTEWE